MWRGGWGLTVIKGVNSTAKRDLIRSDDANVDGDETARDPPTDRVTQEVDLLAGIVLGPEAHTPEQEGPLVRLAGIRMAAGQLVVVPEHGPLQLKPLLQEGQPLHLFRRLLAAGVICWQRRDVLDEPDVGAGRDLLVAVDLLLLVTPVGQGSLVGPHSNLARVVNKLEVTGNALEVLAILSVLNTDLEEGVGAAFAKPVGRWDRRELLVGGVVGRRNIVRQKDRVGAHVSQTNEIVVLDDAAHLLVVVLGNDLPVVVGVVERVAGDLLALTGNTTIIVAERILSVVAVKVGLGLLVLEGNRVVVVDRDGVGVHDIVRQGFLELRRHELVAGTRSRQNGEVDLEPEQVEDEGHDDKSEGTGGEVLSKVLNAECASNALHIKQIPEVDNDGRPDGNKGEESDILSRDVAGQRKASHDQPLPPLTAESLVPQLVKFDVEEETARHGENQGGVQKNQAGLADVGVVKEDEASGHDTGGKAVARLPHDQVRYGHGQGTQNSGHRAERDVGNLVRDIRVANVLEVEVAIVADEPAHKGEQELSKGRVNIEEIGSLEIVRGKLGRYKSVLVPLGL